MDTIKMKWLATGEILELWQTEEHPDAKPGTLVWTDNVYRANWGDAIKWPVPYGFITLDDPDFDLFSPVLSDYWKIKLFLSRYCKLKIFELNIDFAGLKMPGIPKARMKAYKTLTGEDRLVVNFEQRIILPTGERSDRFVIHTQPAIKLNTTGGESEWIPYL